MSYDIPYDDRQEQLIELPKVAPSFASIEPYWLAHYSPDEIEGMTDTKLNRAIRHFHSPAGRGRPKPTRADTEMFTFLIVERRQRQKIRRLQRESAQ